MIMGAQDDSEHSRLQKVLRMLCSLVRREAVHGGGGWGRGEVG